MSVHSAGHSMVATLARAWQGMQGLRQVSRARTPLSGVPPSSPSIGAETKIDQMQHFEIRQKYIGEGWWLETRPWEQRL